ncbi:MAG: hypothetical protein V8R30_04240 [Clostridia bacterium]|mgnify:FL=1|jgi:hypothetical protein
MQENRKNILISIGFVVILILVFIINILSKDKIISTSERRKLVQFPEITTKKVFDGTVSKDFEEYAMDQFVGRDLLRSIKSLFNFEIYRQKDNNKLFIENDSIYKIEYPLKEELIEKTAKRIEQIKEKYLKNMNVYYAIVPDKNYFLEDDNLKMDYEKLQNIMKTNLNNMVYINLFSELSSEDYYRTDIHWKQENIRKAVRKIEKEMNLKDTSKIKYEEKELGEFYGVYYGQIGVRVKPDTMRYLTNDTIENCTTYNFETSKTRKSI